MSHITHCALTLHNLGIYQLLETFPGLISRVMSHLSPTN